MSPTPKPLTFYRLLFFQWVEMSERFRRDLPPPLRRNEARQRRGRATKVFLVWFLSHIFLKTFLRIIITIEKWAIPGTTSSQGGGGWGACLPAACLEPGSKFSPQIRDHHFIAIGRHDWTRAVSQACAQFFSQWLSGWRRLEPLSRSRQLFVTFYFAFFLAQIASSHFLHVCRLTLAASSIPFVSITAPTYWALNI